MLQISMQILKCKTQARYSNKYQKSFLKSSNIKKILCLLYFITSFFVQNDQLGYLSNTILNDLMTLCLFSIQTWRRQTKIEISNIDRFDYTICCCALFARLYIPQLQAIILSLSFFSFKNNLSTILRSVNLLKKIKNLSITILFIILFTAYLFTYLYHSYEATANLFGNFNKTCITMLEILTLDSWGSRGRVLEQQVGYTGLPSIIMCGYVFLMNYFYMNILIGLILEALQLEQAQINNQEEITEQVTKKENYSLDNLMLGQLYQQVVMGFSFTSIFLNIYNNFIIVNSLGQIFDSMDDILYTIHFVLLIFIQRPRINYERSKWERMLLHFIAGPLALFLCHDLACLCNLTKLVTTPLVRGVFSGTIHIFPILLPIIGFLLAIILIMAAYTTTFYSSFIGFKGETYYSTLQQSFFTFIQLLTLDDWDANVLPVFESKHLVLPYILYPIFIIISNVILLNMLIACSCKYFNEIDYSIYQQSVKEKNQIHTLKKLNDMAQLNLPVISLSIPQTCSENYVTQREGLVQICFGNSIVNVILMK